MNSRNILVVDDNEVNRELLSLRLGMNGYQVTTAESGREAMELLRPKTAMDAMRGETGVEFDLVLLDVMMPEVSGIDVLRYARMQHTVADLPIIMVTAKDESEDIVEALKAGANDYVTKPIDFPVLIARMETALQLKYLTRQKDEFLGIASHDLKNPLAVVRGFLRMVKLMTPPGTPMTEDAIDMLQRAEGQTKTMENIITDFLDFQAMEDGQLKLNLAPLNLGTISRRVIDGLADYAEIKQIALAAPPEEGGPVISADESRIQQVLQNLIGNAIKFSNPGGQVEVRTGTADGSALVEIIDRGPGIPEPEQSRLFKKYARISNHPTGGEKSSGVGLAICKKLVELHGGEIGARNNYDAQGATFWFTLPV